MWGNRYIYIIVKSTKLDIGQAALSFYVCVRCRAGEHICIDSPTSRSCRQQQQQPREETCISPRHQQTSKSVLDALSIMVDTFFLVSLFAFTAQSDDAFPCHVRKYIIYILLVAEVSVLSLESLEALLHFVWNKRPRTRIWQYAIFKKLPASLLTSLGWQRRGRSGTRQRTHTLQHGSALHDEAVKQRALILHPASLQLGTAKPLQRAETMEAGRVHVRVRRDISVRHAIAVHAGQRSRWPLGGADGHRRR